MALGLRLLPALALVLCCSMACGPDAAPAPTVPSSSGTSGEGPGPAPTSAPTTGATGTSDAAKPGTKTLFVREVRADCEGEGARKCLQVRESENADWTLFYSSIEGFKYEEGTRYELRVAAEPVGHPPADASSFKYKLVEIVSQQRVPASQ